MQGRDRYARIFRQGKVCIRTVWASFLLNVHIYTFPPSPPPTLPPYLPVLPLLDAEVIPQGHDHDLFTTLTLTGAVGVHSQHSGLMYGFVDMVGMQPLHW